MTNPSDSPHDPPARPIVLVEHDDRWVADFLRESTAIIHALGAVAIEIHHIGSTAIPGIVAKPVIDMLAVVSSVDELDQQATVLKALGYEGLGEFGIPGRRYFRKDDAMGTRTHQVHAFARGANEIGRHLAFRDYLRAHSDVAKEYESLKIDLARDSAANIERYADRKTPFIREVERKAAIWQSERTSGATQ